MLKQRSRITLFVIVLLFDIAKSQINLRPTPTPPSPTSFVYESVYQRIYCSPTSTIQTPNNAGDVQQIVSRAILNGTTVKAFGTRHSNTDIICTDGIPISMQNINYAVDNGNKTATFGAGIELDDALRFLERINMTLIHVPSFSGITIGGAIGTGSHGSSLLHPSSISDQVVALTIVDGNGTLRTISDPGEVNKFRVHLGLLGIIIDITLEIVPLFKMTVENTLQNESILFDETALNWAKQFDSFQMWWFPSFGNVIVSNGTYTQDLTIPGNASTNFVPNEDPVTISATTKAYELLQGTRNLAGELALQAYSALSLYTFVVGKPPIYSADGVTLENPAVGYGWRLQTNKCRNVCAWDNGPGNSLLVEEPSIAFDISQFSAVLTMMKTIFSQYPSGTELIGIFIRFSPSSKALMSIANERDTFIVEWSTPLRSDPFQTARDGNVAYQAILQEMVANFGGRPHWGKNGLYYLSKMVLAKTAPGRQAFIQAMANYDPHGIFLNKFGNRILGISDAMDMNPRVTRCALQDFCICSKAADCAPGQTCTKVNGFNVCKDVLGILPPPLPPLPKLEFNDLSNLTDILVVIGVL